MQRGLHLLSRNLHVVLDMLFFKQVNQLLFIIQDKFRCLCWCKEMGPTSVK